VHLEDESRLHLLGSEMDIDGEHRLLDEVTGRPLYDRIHGLYMRTPPRGQLPLAFAREQVRSKRARALGTCRSAAAHISLEVEWMSGSSLRRPKSVRTYPSLAWRGDMSARAQNTSSGRGQSLETSLV
jgi:hypothetical protein